ncbi:hypothetical protein [Clostridium fallax]|uniref:Uncharacterized protein n=1 Tax=Clostridium fallax TaxID=1533 RepID=A0A1M4TVI9_9CLOT|nr:hypothetical protein [Clostridium fallax]SHE48502.1 hypothetical protein SAMN05443638_103146 [Clostridium fallax]SQB22370.1 Uncharacterised protein [Clostridium fallax]
MRIIVKSKGNKDIKVMCPMCFIRFFIRFGFLFSKCSAKYNKYEKYLNIVNPRILNKELRQLNRKYKGLTIVDIEDNDGDGVKIIL